MAKSPIPENVFGEPIYHLAIFDLFDPLYIFFSNEKGQKAF